jgi:hypothetical protein
MAERLIIGLFGKKRAGKDSLADQLVNSFGFKKWHFADDLRRVMEAFDPIIDTEPTGGPIRLNQILAVEGWEDAKIKYPEVRRIMKYLGTNGVRHVLGQDTWLKSLESHMKDSPDICHVIADGRFLNESEWVREQGGLVVKVHRRWAEPQDVDSHESETELDLIEPDMDIMNTEGLDGLRRYAQDIVFMAKPINKV